MKLPLSPCDRTGARLLLALALVVVAWLMLSPAVGRGGIPINDKLAHLLVFAGLALLTHASWPDRDFDWLLALPLLAYGATLEGLQYFVPGRFFSWADILADAAGLLLYGLLLPRLLPRLS